MDPMAIGGSAGLALISSQGTKLIQKASDPEAVAASIHWVFSAVDNFIKIRKQQKPPDTPISPPPVTAAPPVQDEQKVPGIEESINTISQPVSPSNDLQLRLLDLDEFSLVQLDKEITSLMNQIETYFGNLNFEEEKAAQYGGATFAPPIVMNTIRIQQEEIARRIVRLNKSMQKAYGVSAPNLEVLVEASQLS
jgi:hypothetical protein